ncbi:DNA-binding protein [Streptomyces globosus]|uniref:DNA-binding protein n=1 Tax=Streptomyces globosus TaxID=68209 RepID=A0A344U030_9ACTN|nr:MULTISPECIES: pyridoxamine 5'-phosphate oxidase family protein [Streptomyces]AXE24251.1 DNA-binding protein [Streptomyces globosus]
MSTINYTAPGLPPGSRGRAVAGRTALGRRVAALRAAAHLTREELGERCGVDAHYLACVEDHVVVPAIGTLVRLAQALGTTVDSLVAGGSDGEAGPRNRPIDGRLVPLDEGECRRLLGVRGIGRVAVFASDGPAVHPVNYLVAGDGIAFRTGADTVLARAAGTEAAFEAEQIDEVAARGWSVLAVGELTRAVAASRDLERSAAAANFVPWADGARSLWMKITPVRITGRRVVSP